jgi:hypothetical protein
MAVAWNVDIPVSSEFGIDLKICGKPRRTLGRIEMHFTEP